MSRQAARARRARRSQREFPDFPVDIRVGSRRAQDQGFYLYLRVSGPRDADRFEKFVGHIVKSNPGDPILLICNGFQPWLEDVFDSCLDGVGSDRTELNRETHYADTLRFPECTYRRLQRRLSLPWSFIVDQINVPDVYYWTFRQRPPDLGTSNPPVDYYRFRVGVWTCAQGAYRNDRKVPVAMLFVQNTDISEQVATELLFPFVYGDSEYAFQRSDEDWVAFIFLKLFALLTDWQNVLREFEGHLAAAEKNSRAGHGPVKNRTRSMHHQIDRIYELLLYLRFHSACCKKLTKQNEANNGKGSKASDDGNKSDHTDAGDDPIWDELDDEVEELDQVNYELDALKERFNNLTDLEFNIENAKQSDSSRFLTIVATLFLPLSYLASIWGITTFTATPIEYLYAAIPVFVVSLIFLVTFPPAVRFTQRKMYPAEKERLQMRQQDYSMLGEGLPDALDAPGAVGRVRARREKVVQDSRPRRRSKSARREKSSSS